MKNRLRRIGNKKKTRNRKVVNITKNGIFCIRYLKLLIESIEKEEDAKIIKKKKIIVGVDSKSFISAIIILS